MKIYEITATARSGHHAMLNWLIKNISGYEYQNGDKYKILPNGLYYINETNHTKDISKEFIEKNINNIRSLILSYENTKSDYTLLNETEIYTSTMSITNKNLCNFTQNYRIVFIRDFYNNLASRIKSNNDRLSKNQKPYWDVGKIFISIWKDNARCILNDKCLYLKYEDWLNSKQKRNNFISKIINNGELFDNNVTGTYSSFSDNDFMSRWKNITFPSDIKELVKNDNELHYLIGALGYQYKEI